LVVRITFSLNQEAAIRPNFDLAAGAELTHALVDRGADRGREVERSLVSHHRERDASIGESIEDVARQARGLAPKEQVVAAPKLGVKDAARRLGREDPESRGRGALLRYAPKLACSWTPSLGQ
jgi:hypothetical protein